MESISSIPRRRLTLPIIMIAARKSTRALPSHWTSWAAKTVQLRFIGAENFERVLRNATPSGDKGVNPAWWKLRMELLRVMHRPDEFELVALDYCVTYEVSPPSWDSARCEYKPLQPDGSYAPGATIIGEAFHDSLSSGLGYGDTAQAGNSVSLSNTSRSTRAVRRLSGRSRRGVGRMTEGDDNPMHPAQRLFLAARCTAHAKRTGTTCKAPAVKGWSVCRMHGAKGGAPSGPGNGMWRHGGRSADTALIRRYHPSGRTGGQTRADSRSARASP